MNVTNEVVKGDHITDEITYTDGAAMENKEIIFFYSSFGSSISSQ